ncbi:hypothetical protein [Mesorhizobium helmanticense]|uniref:hypothetical protein n=1 Tax=Mesorhizobium helmanticense TaxID=1776423 RepID=UPI0011B262DD|nr:hypothetical protein [Mesorhizobium helmanticense]
MIADGISAYWKDHFLDQHKTSAKIDSYFAGKILDLCFIKPRFLTDLLGWRRPFWSFLFMVYFIDGFFASVFAKSVELPAKSAEIKAGCEPDCILAIATEFVVDIDGRHSLPLGLS